MLATTKAEQSITIMLLSISSIVSSTPITQKSMEVLFTTEVPLLALMDVHF